MQADLKWLDDPGIFRVGTLAAHSDHQFYKNEQELEQGKNSLAQSLKCPATLKWQAMIRFIM